MENRKAEMLKKLGITIEEFDHPLECAYCERDSRMILIMYTRAGKVDLCPTCYILLRGKPVSEKVN